MLLSDRAAQAAAKNVLLHGRTLLSCAIQEKLVGVEYIVSEKFIEIPMKRTGTGLQYRIHVPAAVPALTGVIERGLDFKFLNDVRIRQGHISRLRNVVVSGADAFDQVVVVVLALAVDDHAGIAASELG